MLALNFYSPCASPVSRNYSIPMNLNFCPSDLSQIRCVQPTSPISALSLMLYFILLLPTSTPMFFQGILFPILFLFPASSTVRLCHSHFQFPLFYSLNVFSVCQSFFSITYLPTLFLLISVFRLNAIPWGSLSCLPNRFTTPLIHDGVRALTAVIIHGIFLSNIYHSH